jgi:hypothetical protein
MRSPPCGFGHLYADLSAGGERREPIAIHLPYSRIGDTDGVYFTDASALTRFLPLSSIDPVSSTFSPILLR